MSGEDTPGKKNFFRHVAAGAVSMKKYSMLQV
jgi:hypothetical protein